MNEARYQELGARLAAREANQDEIAEYALLSDLRQQCLCGHGTMDHDDGIPMDPAHPHRCLHGDCACRALRAMGLPAAPSREGEG